MTDRSPPEDAQDELSTDAIEAAVGPVEEDKRVHLTLGDGRMIVARGRTVQDGEHEYEFDNCVKRFDTERALQTHIGRWHHDLAIQTLPVCRWESD